MSVNLMSAIFQAELAELFPDRKPIDWLDEKERELEAGRVWVLTRKGK